MIDPKLVSCMRHRHRVSIDHQARDPALRVETYIHLVTGESPCAHSRRSEVDNGKYRRRSATQRGNLDATILNDPIARHWQRIEPSQLSLLSQYPLRLAHGARRQSLKLGNALGVDLPD